MRKVLFANEKGVALVVALVMLLILTLIGINAVTTTTFETNIAGNERVATDAFYASEAGIQVALNQLNRFPVNLTPISRTGFGENSYFWSGSPEDKHSPKPMRNHGLYPMPGYELDSSRGWVFYRYQANATGESFGAMKEIEMQIAHGPFSTGY